MLFFRGTLSCLFNCTISAIIYFVYFQLRMLDSIPVSDSFGINLFSLESKNLFQSRISKNWFCVILCWRQNRCFQLNCWYSTKNSMCISVITKRCVCTHRSQRSVHVYVAELKFSVCWAIKINNKQPALESKNTYENV